MFWKNKKIDSWVKKVDKLVTWIIIWWAVASIFWLSQTKKWKEVRKSLALRAAPYFLKWGKKAIWWLWKTVAFFVWVFNKK